ncbi:MAG: 2'-deoxycytidine 5'-triphosphate deaminase [Rhodobacteraceae bacterium]|nr:2'-deoxycytidine 5'-triphosphate deaminase [Paracoccaceae bacterium]
MRTGVLPDHMIAELHRLGVIRSETPLHERQIQPASLDLRLGSKACRVRTSFLAGKRHRVEDRIAEFGMHEFSLENGAVLERGGVYVVKLLERLELPPSIHAVANARSTSGRIDLLVRIITDEGCEFDRIRAGYQGPLFAEICPRSFSVLVRTGSKLNQIRFSQGRAGLSDSELTELCRNCRVMPGDPVVDGGLAFSVDLKRDSGPAGYNAKAHAGIIDVDSVEACRIGDYWDALNVKDGKLILDPGQFYILSSRETVSIPAGFAAEMVPYLPMVGEFRVHYAGFFDPGFGAAETGGQGSRSVLEVRCHEAPFLLEHGQTVGKLAFERMLEPPAKPYGATRNSTYQGQGLRLSMHFR